MTNTVQTTTLFEAIQTMEGENKQILQSIADNKLFIDNHNKKIQEVTEEKFLILLLEDSVQQYLCPAYKNTYFCMNPLQMEDDEYVHLSTWSVAGTLHRCKDIQQMVDACNEYNENSICGAKVKAVIELQ